MKMQKWVWVFATFVLFFAIVAFRSYFESTQVVRGGAQKAIVGSTWDPRGFDLISQTLKTRESNAFRARLNQGLGSSLSLPGLQALHLSWTWLQMLQAIHIESSYDRDFSWIFSKLHFLIRKSHPSEVLFITSLAPFYLVIGRDHPGATILVEEMVTRQSRSYNPWFWAGFHALENIFLHRLAADYYEKASFFPDSPEYLISLAMRLRLGDVENLSPEQLKYILENESNPEVLSKIREMRPEWFKDE